MRCEAVVAVAAASKAKLDCHVCLTGETKRLPGRTGKPGLGPAADPLFAPLRQKVGQKGGPYDGGPRFARTPRAASAGNGKRPKLAALRQRTLLYPFPALATRRHLTGIHVKSNGNGNGNGNGRCAGKGNCNGRCADKSGRRHLAASMFTGVV